MLPLEHRTPEGNRLGIEAMELIEQEALLATLFLQISIHWKTAMVSLKRLQSHSRFVIKRRSDGGVEMPLPPEFREILNKNRDVFAIWIRLGGDSGNGDAFVLNRNKIKTLIALKSKEKPDVKKFGQLIEDQYIVSEWRTFIESIFVYRLTALPYRATSWKTPDRLSKIWRTILPRFFRLTNQAKLDIQKWTKSMGKSLEQGIAVEQAVLPKFAKAVGDIAPSYWTKQVDIYNIIIGRCLTDKQKINKKTSELKALHKPATTSKYKKQAPPQQWVLEPNKTGVKERKTTTTAKSNKYSSSSSTSQLHSSCPIQTNQSPSSEKIQTAKLQKLIKNGSFCKKQDPRVNRSGDIKSWSDGDYSNLSDSEVETQR